LTLTNIGAGRTPDSSKGDHGMAGEEGRCACAQEPSEEELLSQLDDILQSYVSVPGALIPVLQIAQGLFGYLPETALKKISLALNKSYSEVAGVVGFYSFFTTVPRGKHLVRACLGTACYVRGGKQVLQTLRTALGIEVGETTSDRLFSLDVGRCFGACGLAPVIMIDDEVHQSVKPAKIAKILDGYRHQVSGEGNGNGNANGENAGGRP
jgi:NADH:ubiquinone oxidoreductase subunit E